MRAFPSLLTSEYTGGRYDGFGSRIRDNRQHVVAIIKNLGFLYNLRTGELYVRVMSAIKEEKKGKKKCVKK